MKKAAFWNKAAKFLATRGVGYFLTLPALAFLIAALCLYVKNGVTSFNPELNVSAIVYAVVACVFCVGGLCLDFKTTRFVAKPVKYIAYCLCLCSFLWFVFSQVTYIANVFVAIDGYTFTGGFIATMVFYALSLVFLLLAAALHSWCPWQKKDKTEHGNDITETEVTA